MNALLLSTQQRERLQALSAQLLGLHKLLLDRDRVMYEQAHGPIGSTGEYLNLVLTHDSFGWLRQLSGLIVQVDEVLAPRAEATSEAATAAREQIRRLLVPAEHGSSFQQNYWSAIQNSPDILILHREIQSRL